MITVNALRPSVNRHKIDVKLRHLLVMRVFREFLDGRTPRHADDLSIRHDAAQQVESGLRHALLDGEHVVALGHDVSLAQTETPFQGRFKLFIRIALDLYLDNAALHRLLELLADGRAVNAHARGNLALLQMVEIVHAGRLDQDASLYWHHDVFASLFIVTFVILFLVCSLVDSYISSKAPYFQSFPYVF